MPKLDEQTQRARREHILDAADRCFARQGFHRTSMQDICRDAGISAGALYLYFTSKEALIAGICEREKTALAQGLAAIADSPDFIAALSELAETYCIRQPEEKLRLYLEINAEATRNPEIGRSQLEIDNFIVKSFEKLLSDAKAKGRIDPTVDESTIAQVISIFGDGLMQRRALDPAFDTATCLPVILSLLSSIIRPVQPAEAGAGETKVNANRETVG